MVGLAAIAWACVAAAAPVETPDENWAPYPGSDAGTPAESGTPPPPSDVSAPPAPHLERLSRQRPLSPRFASTPIRPAEMEGFNDVSVYGAKALGPFHRALGVFLGFPLLEAKFAMGVWRTLDAGVVVDTMYGVMEDFRLHLRWQVVDGRNWTAALAAEGGWAIFAQPPQAEGNGPRWITGRRDFNVAPGAILSYRGDTPHSARMFLDVRCALAFDAHPYEVNPLGGIPPSVVTSVNLPVRMGAEMPFSTKTSFLFSFGFDIHGRSSDSSFMVAVAVGVVTSV